MKTRCSQLFTIKPNSRLPLYSNENATDSSNVSVKTEDNRSKPTIILKHILNYTVILKVCSEGQEWRTFPGSKRHIYGSKYISLLYQNEFLRWRNGWRKAFHTKVIIGGGKSFLSGLAQVMFYGTPFKERDQQWWLDVGSWSSYQEKWLFA